MKWKRQIAGLLAVYMLALMLVPCNDICETGRHDTSAVNQQAQDHHQEDSDLCSPFCFCSCCTTAMTVIHLASFNIVPSYTVSNFSSLNPFFFSQAYSSIWQPPKLS